MFSNRKRNLRTLWLVGAITLAFPMCSSGKPNVIRQTGSTGAVSHNSIVRNASNTDKIETKNNVPLLIGLNTAASAGQERKPKNIDRDKDSYTAEKGDCDNLNPAIHPKAQEVCNGIDDDCDGKIDEGCPFNLTFGGKRDDSALSIVQGNYGGYVIAGQTRSYGAGKRDAWVIQIDEDGNRLWYETFGGKGDDSANCIIRGNKDGYIIAGQTQTNGDGNIDARIIKFDEDAVIQWSHTFGGKRDDQANSICPGNHTGYVIAGQTSSSGKGDWDVWIIKVGNNGKKLWEKTFGGPRSDVAHAIVQGKNGGYVIAGQTQSYGKGDWDAWIIKITENGRLSWYETFGDKNSDTACSIIQDKDVGYIVAGESRSADKASCKAWILKIAENGNILWDQPLGGAHPHSAASIIQDNKGGYIIAGWSQSGAGGKDAWILKINENGHDQWRQTYGGSAHDAATAIIQGNKGGYLMAGWTTSYGTGGTDAWIIKTDDKGRAPTRP